MTNQPIDQYISNSSSLAYGCMGLGGSWDSSPVSNAEIRQAHDVIDTALDCNIKFFDHADIYTMGKAEQVFGEVLKTRPELRDQITLQSKCGIRFEDQKGPKRFDFSSSYIKNSVDGILSRLHVESIDILLLHRPDPLMEPEDVAEAFTYLKQSGKVNHFGVSNMNAVQMGFLQQHLNFPLVANQLELNLLHLGWLDDIVLANNPQGKDLSFGSGTFEYCRTNKVQIQSWGSLCQGLLTGRDLSGQPTHIQQTAALVTALATEYQTSQESILLAFLMRHPARIQPVIGTTNTQRIRACSEAANIVLSREHWYALYVSARGEELP